MDFLEVSKELKQGKAYRHKSWRSGIYICMNSYGCIQQHDGYHGRKDIKFKIEDILSTDWEECPKTTWYLIAIEGERLPSGYHHNLIGWRLSDKPDGYHPWYSKELDLEELKEYAYFSNIEIVENDFSEDVLSKLKEILHQK